MSTTETTTPSPQTSAKANEPPTEAPPIAKSVNPSAAPLFGARIAFGLAVFSGLLYWLGFPGVDIWPLALVSQVPLLLALRHQKPRRALLLGLVAGLTMNLTGFSWLIEMLRVFSGFPTPLCLLFMAILCAYQGGRIGLAGYLYARAERRGWPPGIVFVLAFIASELVYPLLFPWYFGASVHNFLPLLQTGDLVGPYAIAVVLLGTNVAIAEVIEARLVKRGVDVRALVIALVPTVLGAIYGAVRMSMVASAMAAAPKVRIGIAQGNMPLLGRNKAMQAHLRLTQLLKDRGAELVVWSEGSIPRAFLETPDLGDVQKYLGEKVGVPAIVGSILVREGEHRVLFNTALLLDEHAKVLGRYDKTYLLAFGEYLPFGETFPVLYQWSPNSGHFLSGDKIESLAWGEHRISTLICYEDILPSFVNKLVRHGDPDLLVNLTNDAWFGDSAEPWEHLALAKLRAVEHRRFLVRSTNSGVSAVIDALGGVVVHGGTFKEEALIGEARFMRSTTVYEIVGDVPVWLAALAVFAMGFFDRRKPAAKAAA